MGLVSKWCVGILWWDENLYRQWVILKPYEKASLPTAWAILMSQKIWHGDQELNLIKRD